MASQLHIDLFNQMRILVGEPVRDAIDDRDKAMALTVLAELNHLGFDLQPKDAELLAHCNTTSVMDIVHACCDVLDAQPMYPGFPQQVIEMPEAIYRFNQLLHYMSTYGIEYVTGAEVQRGWLPAYESPERTVDDINLLELRIVELMGEGAAIQRGVKLLEKKERLTLAEARLVQGCIDAGAVPSEVPFKENIAVVASCAKDATELKSVLKALCLHAGDVLDTAYLAIQQSEKKRLTTSQRRAYVTVIEECFTPENLAENLSLKRKRNKYLVRELSWRKMSHSPEHAQVVDLLCANKLSTWKSRLEELLAAGDHTAVLDYAKQRPGELLRMCGRLLRLGYTPQELEDVLRGASFKRQTLLSNLQFFSKNMHDICYEPRKGQSISRTEDDVAALRELFMALLRDDLTHTPTSLAGKRVFLREGDFDFARSTIDTNGKNDEGGYIRSGLAFRIPEDAKVVRFFCYWNDEERIDIDLHARAIDVKGDTYTVGWNTDYIVNGMSHSGDITHSDAAEFLDVNLAEARQTGVVSVSFSIQSFTRVPFNQIETVFTGLLAVNNVKLDAKFYNAKNLFFRHDLKFPRTNMRYATLDVAQGTLVLAPSNDFDPLRGSDDNRTPLEAIQPGFSLMDYLVLLCETQGATIVDAPEDAEVALRLDKPERDEEISLLDVNFFLDVPAER